MFNPVAPYRYLIPAMYLLWQISQIQTCLCDVIGPGFISTSPAFMRSSASHPAGPHDRRIEETVSRATIAVAGDFDTICTAVCNRCNSFTACRMCRLVPLVLHHTCYYSINCYFVFLVPLILLHINAFNTIKSRHTGAADELRNKSNTSIIM